MDQLHCSSRDSYMQNIKRFFTDQRKNFILGHVRGVVCLHHIPKTSHRFMITMNWPPCTSLVARACFSCLIDKVLCISENFCLSDICPSNSNDLMFTKQRKIHQKYSTPKIVGQPCGKSYHKYRPYMLQNIYIKLIIS